MLKLAENPPILSPRAARLADLCGHWWVGHTKARFEKAFAWDLLRRDIGYFLPLFPQVKISGGKKRRLLMPLFPSYVFFCGTDVDRYEAMKTDRLCQTIEVKDQQNFVAELSHIERILSGQIKIDPYPFAPVGARCRVKAGPFVGTEGIVIERKDARARMVLQISLLSQGAAIEIDADLLEPVEA